MCLRAPVLVEGRACVPFSLIGAMCLVAGRLDWIFFELLVESFLLWKKEDQSPYLADHQDCERGLIRSSWYGHVSDPCVDSLLLIVVHRGRGWKFPLRFRIASIVS